MKRKFVLITFLFTFLAPLALRAGTHLGNDMAEADSLSGLGLSTTYQALTNALTVPVGPPRGPQDLVQDYSAEMAAIAQRFTASLGQIDDAVRRGELSSEQGKEISSEQYEQAQMQFQLLGALRDMLEQDLAGAAATQGTHAAPAQDTPANGTVALALPFSSLQLNPSLSQYLNLSQSQIEAIQQLMEREKRDLEPLMAQLRTTRTRLLGQGADKPNESQIRNLASTEAGLIAKLIVTNARMQAKIYKLLTPEQQKKLDAVKRSSESAGSPKDDRQGSDASLARQSPDVGKEDKQY